MSVDKLKAYLAAQAKDEANRLSEKWNIFVGGPYIDLKKTIKAKINSESDEKKLRFSVLKHFEKIGHTVFAGEDDELKKVGESNYGQHNDAAVYEIHYLLKHLDAIILFPCSPGSFCELGGWTIYKDICPKMMIIIDKKHFRRKNYINDGVIQLAKRRNATIKYLNYKNIDEVIIECDTFLRDRFDQLRFDRLANHG